MNKSLQIVYSNWLHMLASSLCCHLGFVLLGLHYSVETPNNRKGLFKGFPEDWEKSKLKGSGGGGGWVQTST